MTEKKFYDWAMNELKIVRKEAEEIEDMEHASDLEKDLMQHKKSIIEMAETIFLNLYANDKAGIESYCAINMVKKLLDREPLTAVTDDFDQWKIDGCYDSPTRYAEGTYKPMAYHHVRNGGLFKIINGDGSFRITDIDRVRYADLASEYPDDFSFSNSFITKLIDEEYHPIKFPYVSENVRVKIYRLDGDAIREDLPTVMEIICFSVNDGPFKPIHRYYRYNRETNFWDEINRLVYCNHKSVILTAKTVYDQYSTTKKGCEYDDQVH